MIELSENILPQFSVRFSVTMAFSNHCVNFLLRLLAVFSISGRLSGKA